MKNFLKQVKTKIFKRPLSFEIVLFILVVAVLLFKFKVESKNNIPKGDFGPSPYDKHLEKSGLDE